MTATRTRGEWLASFRRSLATAPDVNLRTSAAACAQQLNTETDPTVAAAWADLHELHNKVLAERRAFGADITSGGPAEVEARQAHIGAGLESFARMIARCPE